MLYNSSQLLHHPRRVILVTLRTSFFVFISVSLMHLQRGAFGNLKGSEFPDSTTRSKVSLSQILIDYPEDGSIFPPGITPPMFMWRDSTATSWHIDLSFNDKTPAIHVVSKGERFRIGAIDPECIGSSNEPPELTPERPQRGPGLPIKPRGLSSRRILRGDLSQSRSSAIARAKYRPRKRILPF